MLRYAMFVAMFQLYAGSAFAASAQIDFHQDRFGAGFAGDAIYFISRTHAGEEMTVLVANTEHLCDAIKTRHGDVDVRVWVAEVTQRADQAFALGTGSHLILNDADLYDDTFEHRGGVAMLAYMHKRASARQAPAFVGMAARGHVQITAFDPSAGEVTGSYNATFQLGYNQGAGGYVQAPSSGRFHARHCPEGANWQQALLGVSTT